SSFSLSILSCIHMPRKQAVVGVWAQWMQALDLLSSYLGRLGHEKGAAELAQRYPAWLEGFHCFGGNRSLTGTILVERGWFGLGFDTGFAALFTFLVSFCKERER